jgi:hypothetical protein
VIWVVALSHQTTFLARPTPSVSAVALRTPCLLAPLPCSLPASQATALLEEASRAGYWVLLQNCHLAQSWMPALERHVMSFIEAPGELNINFRLFLTSFPEPHFPLAVLQNGVKLTNEPPRVRVGGVLQSPTHRACCVHTVHANAAVGCRGRVGKCGERVALRSTACMRPPRLRLRTHDSPPSIACTRTHTQCAALQGLKANLVRSWETLLGQAHLDGGPDVGGGVWWQKLLFGLTFFHAVVQVRGRSACSAWRRIAGFSKRG